MHTYFLFSIFDLLIKLISVPIPAFDHNHVLPPHTGNPTNPMDVSPYECTIMEFCQHFATSPQRIVLLKSFIEFRLRMLDFKIQQGFQWIDGSFTENIEISGSRDPRDIDVVTFYMGLSTAQEKNIADSFQEFISPILSKRNYHLDHYPVNYGFRPDITVEATRYWIQLFSHNRDRVWKGMIKINT